MYENSQKVKIKNWIDTEEKRRSEKTWFDTMSKRETERKALRDSVAAGFGYRQGGKIK